MEYTKEHSTEAAASLENKQQQQHKKTATAKQHYRKNICGSLWEYKQFFVFPIFVICYFFGFKQKQQIAKHSLGIQHAPQLTACLPSSNAAATHFLP